MELLQVFEQGNYSQIIDYWDNNQLQASQDPDSAFIAAAAHFRLGNLSKACEICETLEGPLSNNASFLSMYAAILRRLNLLTRASEIFQQALFLEPDSKEIKNNYSNLLIDQKKYDQATKLLEEILQVSPNYQDALCNLERCKSIVQELEISKSEKTKAKDASNNVSNDVFGDPLEEAFNPTEVGRIGGKIGQTTAAIHDLLDPNETKNIEQAGLEMIKLATEMVNKKQYIEAIDLLINIRKNNNCLHGQTYKLASDAFIGLERFKDAELFALMALQNGEKTISVLVNLASFAAMRKDQFMAKYWITEAEKIDSTNNNVKQCRELLFPSNKSREKDEPFKIK